MMCSTSIGAPPLAIDLKIRLSITSVTHCWIQNFPTSLQFCLEVSETLPQILHFPNGIPGLLVVKILQDHPESNPPKTTNAKKVRSKRVERLQMTGPRIGENFTLNVALQRRGARRRA